MSKPTVRLLLSIPISDAAQKYYGSHAQATNLPGDSGVDLPFIHIFSLQSTVAGGTYLLSTETVFAMYDTNIVGCTNIQNLAYLYGVSDFSATDPDVLGFLCSKLTPLAFMIAPRSSISKTPFRLANSMGIIDKGYRGINEARVDSLMACLDFHPQLFDSEKHKPYILKGTRLVQIISPGLEPILHHRLDFTPENITFWQKHVSGDVRGGFGSTGTGV